MPSPLNLARGRIKRKRHASPLASAHASDPRACLGLAVFSIPHCAPSGGDGAGDDDDGDHQETPETP